MVRLQSSDPGESAYPQVLERLLSSNAAGTKRTRSQTKSSLDFKHPGANNNVLPGEYNSAVTTEKISLKETQQANGGMSNDNSRQSQHQRPKIATRARGSSGIPPRKTKLDLSDLQGMSEQQIMQALYADPELAELAAEQIAKAQKKQKRRSSAGTSTSEPNANGFSGGARIDKGNKVEKGIPYEQWCVLLVLVGIGAYQLYKSLSGPNSKPGSSSKRDVSTSLKGKVKGTGLKNKKGRGAAGGPTMKRKENSVLSSGLGASSIDVVDVDKVVAEIEGTKSSTASSETIAAMKKLNKIKKKKRIVTSESNKHTNNVKKEDEVSPLPVVADITDNSSLTEKSHNTQVQSRVGIISAEDYSDMPIEEEVWKTVSKSKNSSSKAAKKPLDSVLGENNTTMPIKANGASTTTGSDLQQAVGFGSAVKRNENGSQNKDSSNTKDMSPEVMGEVGDVEPVESMSKSEDTILQINADTQTEEAIDHLQANPHIEEPILQPLPNALTEEPLFKSNTDAETEDSDVRPDTNTQTDEPVVAVSSEDITTPVLNVENGKTDITSSKKKKKKKNTSATIGNNTKNQISSNTSDDAALALQLQHYEERMAALEHAVTKEDEKDSDVWAEVPIKKNKKSKKTDNVGVSVKAVMSEATQLEPTKPEVVADNVDDEDDDDE